MFRWQSKHIWSSNKKLKRDNALLVAHFGNSFCPRGGRMSGHHSNRWAVIPDTPENRQWIKKQNGISISRSMNKNN